jgi:hypothetical protein
MREPGLAPNQRVKSALCSYRRVFAPSLLLHRLALMNKAKNATRNVYRALVLGVNLAIAVARPDLSAVLHNGSSLIPGAAALDRTNVALDASITTFKTIKEVAEGLPTLGGPFKVTCGVMILVLETLKVCLLILRKHYAHFYAAVQR